MPLSCAGNTRSRKWTPPPSAILKLNVDAPVATGSPHIGVRLVVHDDSSMIVATHYKKII
ncbi:hypothetical protein TorRG33x02_138570 [Trema orientale]|uniref:Uncharacterized protein n=1 Tax=Trema orientale TaxID=63057 RepID=A0A2P5EXX3_TREOI|nr:hypothetical protein TorRG33x02_138570 [Trema orientale]